MKITFKLMAATAILFAACKKDNISEQSAVQSSSHTVSEAMVNEDGNNPDEAVLNSNSKQVINGHVYLESNDAGGNSIIVYNQQADGTLAWMSTIASGGKGTGAGLGSESAIAINEDNSMLFAVNAGSNSVSSFKIKNNGNLELKYTTHSGGMLPLSVCVYDDLLYVVNSTSANISGFKIGWDGSLTGIQGSHKSLSDLTAGPAQIAFSPGGSTLLVTEKGTSKIASFAVTADGGAKPGMFADAVGVTPFGFDFSRNMYMIVSNASMGAANKSTCTSYSNLDWNVTAVNGAVPNFQSASCWVATTKNGRFAYVTDAGTNNIVTYYVDASGNIYYLPWSAVASGAGPIDITVSKDNMFVYNINSGDHTITEFKRSFLGILQPIGSIASIPMAAAGIISD